MKDVLATSLGLLLDEINIAIFKELQPTIILLLQTRHLCFTKMTVEAIPFYWREVEFLAAEEVKTCKDCIGTSYNFETQI